MAGNLPHDVTTFIERRTAEADIRTLLGTARLLTLTGSGGVGKTRLALTVATRVERAYPDGVWMVDLTRVRTLDTDLVARTILEELGEHDQSPRSQVSALRDYLRGRHTLLVLDNCEHLADAVADIVADLLRAAPRLTVLATSRRALLAPELGEYVYLIDRMATPDPGDDPSGWQHSEALALMQTRAAAAGYTAPDDSARRALAQACQRTEGLPLAIELVAAWLRTLTPAEVLDRLDATSDDRLALLPGMDEVGQWSYRWCSPQERLLWERLSVFVGGFDLPAAEHICSGDDLPASAILPVLDSLVTQSLVHADRSGTTTLYRMLEPIREFGQRRLAERHGNAVPAQRAAHLDYYRSLTAHIGDNWCTPAELTYLMTLQRHHANLRAAVSAAETTPSQARAGLEMVVNLTRARFHFLHGSLSETLSWLDRLSTAVARQTPRTSGPDMLRITAAAAAAFIAMTLGHPSAQAWVNTCRSLARECNPVPHVVLFINGVAAFLLSNDDAAIELLAHARDATRHAERVGDASPGDIHMAQLVLALAAALRSDPVLAAAAAEECLRHIRRLGAPWATDWARLIAGLVELRHGDPAAGTELIRTTLREVRQWGDRWAPPWATEWLYWAYARQRQAERAAETRAAAETLRHGIDVMITRLAPFAAAHAEADVHVLPPAQPQSTYTNAHQRGTGLPYDEAIALALDEGTPTNQHDPGHPDTSINDPLWQRLTPREREVAGLVGEGLMDAQIATRLVLSKRTVEQHVSHILGKADFPTRTGIVTWYSRLPSPPP